MPPPAPRSASLLLALLVGGCSGTPFGETLSRSFSGGAPTPEPLSPDAPRGGVQPPAAPAAKPGGSAPTVPAPARAAVAPTASSGPTPPALRPPANPAPYRVTILLPQADPAAPAEVVTRALRSAGVPFEVETIQRTAPGEAPRPAPPSPAATPGSAPPAAPAAPAAPSVRPALPPR